jgi:hypothetical protein
MGTGVLSPGVKRGRGVTLTTAEVKNEWELYLLPPNASMDCSGTAYLSSLVPSQKPVIETYPEKVNPFQKVKKISLSICQIRRL